MGAEHYVADWVETLMTAYLGEVGRDVVFTTGFDRPLYPPFANGGHGVIPNVISQIDTVEGEVLYRSSQSDPGRLLTDQQVGMMNDMLGSSVEVGTSSQAQFGDWAMGGKTGTSQRNRDALFVGYTARYVGGVWLGNDDDSPTRAFGGQIPARIWRDVMVTAHEGQAVTDLPGDYVRLHNRHESMPVSSVPGP